MEILTSLLNNWEWVLLGFYAVEKIVKITPTKYDDIVVDMLVKPGIDLVKNTILGFKNVK